MCSTSRNYPNKYHASDTCTLTVLGPAAQVSSVGVFETESCCDYLTIGTSKYSGASGPKGVAVQPGDKISWVANGGTEGKGFKICLGSLPPPPGLAPSEEQVLKSKSFVVNQGQLTIKLTACQDCPPGRFSNVSNATGCDACPVPEG